MEIYHRVAINSEKDSEFYASIKEIELQYKSQELPGRKSNLLYFDISESDPNWTKISNLIETYGASNVIETFFSNDEIKNAEWVRIMALEHGLPQPEATWPVKQLSYDDVCPKCAIHNQTKSMRMRDEPKIGKKSFMSLTWANEIFCTPDVFSCLEAIGAKGYEVWDAVLHKTSQPVQKVHQLYIPGIASPGLVLREDLKHTVCPICGKTKYYPHMRGIMYLKRNTVLHDTDFMLTHEWFGSGLIAFREILISNRIATLFLDKGWEGFRLKVVEFV
jgi:hypothetical protein